MSWYDDVLSTMFAFIHIISWLVSPSFRLACGEVRRTEPSTSIWEEDESSSDGLLLRDEFSAGGVGGLDVEEEGLLRGLKSDEL